MLEPDSAVVKHEGASLTLRFDACRVALGGEFAGNIELDVTCDAAAVDTVWEHLCVRIPEGEPTGSADATGERAGGVELCFWSEQATTLQELPPHVELLWKGAPIGRIAPVLHESVPLGRVITPTDFSEILETPPVITTSGPVLLVANCEKWWYLLAALMLGLGVVAVPSLPAFGLPVSVWLVCGAAFTGISALGIFLARTPYRRVWLDRDRRRVVVVAGRGSGRAEEVAQKTGRALDEFAHVRLYMRWQISNDVERDDQEVWLVSLEGPIGFAGSDGRVHLRGDALPIGEHRSEFDARKLAAEVAFHTGLPILDTGHDQTA